MTERRIAVFYLAGDLSGGSDYHLWDVATQSWIPDYLITYTYDSNGNLIEILVQVGDPATGGYINSYSYLYSYDINNNVTENLGRDWDEATSAWVNNWRYVYTYDASGYLTTRLYQSWDLSSSAWLNSSQYLYTNDASGNEIQATYQTWDDFYSEYNDVYRYLSYYDETTGYQSEYLNQDWDGASWINDWRYLYSYDPNGNRTVWRYEDWNVSSGIFESTWQYLYSFDVNDYRTELSRQTYDPALSSWVDDFRRFYTYDASGNLTENSGQDWDVSLSSWINTFRNQYSYDSAGYWALLSYQDWDPTNSVWLNDWQWTTIEPQDVLPPMPMLLTVDDIPADQGGRVRLNFLASKFDKADTALALLPIVQYSVWRMIDADNWDALGSFNAVQDSLYHFVAPTLQDSTATLMPWHVFRVSAHTADPTIFWYSDTLGGYSVDNLPPAQVQGVVAGIVVSTNSLELSWQPVSDRDLAGYHIFEFQKGGYDLSSSLAFTTATTQTITYPADGLDHSYVIVAVDIHDNLGPPTAAISLSVLGVDTGPGLPEVFALHHNYPNPFNPATTIRFDLPEAVELYMTVYDMLGREVARLAEGKLAAGFHQVIWDARDERGRSVPSGVYFARLTAPGFVRTIKMVLLR